MKKLERRTTSNILCKTGAFLLVLRNLLVKLAIENDKKDATKGIEIFPKSGCSGNKYWNVYPSKILNKVPDAKDFIDVFVPLEKEVIKQNTEQLFKRYKKQFNEYLLPDILENNTKEEEAFKLLERIRKKDVSAQFTIDCELFFVSYF